MYNLQINNLFIQLISVPKDQIVSPISRSGAYQPIGLMSIATFLTSCSICRESEIEILDGEFLTMEDIELQLRGTVIGISCTTPSFKNSLRLAKAAKKTGAIVILGGPHATALSSTILLNRPEIDFIIRGDGEVAMSKLLNGIPFKEIENLSYRSENLIIENPLYLFNLSILPIINRKNINLEKYIDRYLQQPLSIPDRRPIAIYSQKGCQWRNTHGGCIFCGRLDMTWRSRYPGNVWKEIAMLNSEYNINYFWDVSDSFTSSKEWVLKFAELKPQYIDIDMFVYARSSEIDIEICKAFKKIGVKEVFMGIESGSNSYLRSANKGTTIKDNVKAVDLLNSYGIKLFPCFIIGLPNESYESMSRTIEHAELIVQHCECTTISASTLIPLPGSAAFKQVLNTPEGKSLFSGIDDLDLETLGQFWVNNFCSVSWKEIHNSIDTILNLCSKKSSFFNFKK